MLDEPAAGLSPAEIAALDAQLTTPAGRAARRHPRRASHGPVMACPTGSPCSTTDASLPVRQDIHCDPAVIEAYWA
jgi:hypothetical protein